MLSNWRKHSNRRTDHQGSTAQETPACECRNHPPLCAARQGYPHPRRSSSGSEGTRCGSIGIRLAGGSMSTELELQPHQNGMDLIRAAIQGEGTPAEKAALVKELISLQQSMTRFEWEREERQYRIDFDSALNR